MIPELEPGEQIVHVASGEQLKGSRIFGCLVLTNRRVIHSPDSVLKDRGLKCFYLVEIDRMIGLVALRDEGGVVIASGVGV